MELWSSAAIELSEASSTRRRELAVLLPALQRLLHDSGVEKSPYGATLASWARTMQDELAPPPSGVLLKSGWLRKQNRSGLSTKLRWVVLEGSRLMYYPRAPSGLEDAPLKGVLQLHGGTRITPTAHGFTVEAGPTPPELTAPARNVSAGATAASPMLVADGDASASSPGGPRSAAAAAAPPPPDPVLNPLHIEKQRYVWLCGDTDERDAWVEALGAAAAVGAQEASCLRWSAAFISASHAPEVYLRRLAEFRARGDGAASLVVPADWVRVYMATGGRRSVPSGGLETGGSRCRVGEG